MSTQTPGATPPRRPMLLGLLGGLLIAAQPLAFSYLPAPADGVLTLLPNLRTRPGRMLMMAVNIIGLALMSRAWLTLRPSRSTLSTRGYAGVLAVWSLPFLVVPPVQSGDAYAYAAQAWVMHQGWDPYVVAQGTPGPFQAGVWGGWRPTTAVYPPLALFAQLGVLLATGVHPYWSVVGMRALAIVGVALTVALTPQLARDHGADSRRAVWAIACHPLTLILLIGGAHNDALMIGALALALWCGRRGQGWWPLALSAILIGVATGLKQSAVLAAPGVVLAGLPLGRRATTGWLRQWGRVTIAGAIALTTFLVISYGSGLGLGWANDTAGDPASVVSFAPFSWLTSLLRITHLEPMWLRQTIKVTSTMLVLAGIAGAALRWWRTRPLLFSAAALLSFGLLGTAMQPWYLCWVGFFLALVPLADSHGRSAVVASLAVALAALLNPMIDGPFAVLIACAVTALYCWRLRRTAAPLPLEGRA